ncbi:MAG TPA: type IV toxin-antitoxin system AbiEi family antitoxin domain-containing protein [Actinomycetota bacterium]
MAIAEAQHGVISRGQALDVGLSRHGIGTLLARGLWIPVFRGVYRISGSRMSWYQQVTAACLAAGTGAVASHSTAACLWSLPGAERKVEVTVPGARRVILDQVRVHRSVLAKNDQRRHEGIPVTSLARTLIDLASVVSPSRLEEMVDYSLANRLLSLTTLRRRLDSLGRGGRKGAGELAALIAAREARPRGPQSEFERRLLRVLSGYRLPPPVCQHEVRLRSGRRAYLDFAYPEAMLAIEADSYRHHSSRSDWSRDRVRNNDLIAAGWRVLPITFDDMSSQPEAVAHQVAQCLGMSDEIIFEGGRGTSSKHRRRKTALR